MWDEIKHQSYEDYIIACDKAMKAGVLKVDIEVSEPENSRCWNVYVDPRTGYVSRSVN